MKRKVGTLIEDEVLKLAKHVALKERRPMSDLIQDAIVAYLDKDVPSPHKREKAYQLFCERPSRITRKQLHEIMDEDPRIG